MNIPKSEIEKLTPIVKDRFLKWESYMTRKVRFNMPDSEIHAAAHCERVLLYALIIGNEIFGNDSEALDVLAHASIFHDTRRQDEYLDTGHGARAAVYYEEFCRGNSDISYHPESVYLMRYHDLNDEMGQEAIRKSFGSGAERVLNLYAIFKDADALDRWRLGSRGLDPKFLRTVQAREMTGYSRNIVRETMPAELLERIEDAVNKSLERNEE